MHYSHFPSEYIITDKAVFVNWSHRAMYNVTLRLDIAPSKKVTVKNKYLEVTLWAKKVNLSISKQ
ncbi:MAG: hypothetical protein KKH91_02035, partial [Elusimicrobia bacterium]|nr:hypothetical protein [Elusimicrobiota bacterium]